ncbi:MULTISPECIES: pyrimidine 5'-nucleotidase [unclassified Haematospirillum]|uniref:pyrimidine 5'-nucleotidase n=1 Tax=unclassified Haematospirillum TaxID=2622088 RepID=UPI00143BD59E|nr:MULTISPECIES: pyrimidine 5'-nucleotidase [unclassified Haematospirillum]NKD55273.1 pyrimidine 5'-nucleotidase [Haematospirillum sp. H4890]NKD75158.1 pyrimidine 5'-nucleotidase [Haematospirillum sp. H4485]
MHQHAEKLLQHPVDHVTTWLFDLDNTLYPGTSSLFPQVEARIRHFVARHLNLDEDAARILQKQYYHTYGTTMCGLMVEHGVDQHTFLDYVHDIDHSALVPDPALRRVLLQLPGRRLIFTNGSGKHARAVLKALDLEQVFEGVFDIHAAEYCPKPNPQTYHRMTAAFGLDPKTTAFFEDSPQNLETAAAMGMTTVLVHCGPEVPPLALFPEQALSAYCHHMTDHLTTWLEAALHSLSRNQ